jgi:DNA-directed RNA polymerase subunit alpha
MSDTAIESSEVPVDVRGILESRDPDLAELDRLRLLAMTDKGIRQQVDEFMQELPATLADAGRSAAAIRTKGYAWYAVGEAKHAVDWLASAGDISRAKLLLGRSLLAVGRPVEAAEVLTSVDKEEPDARAALVVALAGSGDAAGAKKVLGRLRKAVAESAEGQFLTGYVHEISGEYEEAYKAYHEALEMDPDEARASFRLAYAMDLDGQEDEAVEIYEQIRQRKPTYTNALVNLGVLYEDRGEYSKAMEVYKEIIDVYPNHERARRFLADARASLNMYYDEDLERTEDRRAQILRIPISDFELSVRSRNCLAKMQIETLGDLIKKTEQELLSYKNFGETSLQEIKDILAQKGLRLGMGREEQTSSVQAAARTLLGIEPEQGDAMQKRIEDLELSVRSRNAMRNLGVETLGDLSKLSEKDLMVVKNFGQTSMNEVKEKLAEYGLSLADPS